MAADTYSNLLGVLLMGTGNDNNSWGINANNGIFQVVEDAIAGVLSSSVTGGTLDLSTPAPPSAASLARYKFLKFSGTLLSTQTIKVPALTKEWVVTNGCTGDIYVQTPGGTVTTIPAGTTKHIFCDGTNVTRLDANEIGKVSMFACVTPPGALECDGSSLLRASYPELYQKLGTNFGTVDLNHFSLPLLTDTGRFPRSRRPGTDDFGSYYSNQNQSHSHTGTVSGTTANGGVDHTHSFSGTTSGQSSDHSHTIYGPSGSVANTGSTGGTGNIEGALAHNSGGPSNDHTHTFSGSTSGSSTFNHTHTFSASFTTVTSGGTEARPEAAVFRFCVKY